MPTFRCENKTVLTFFQMPVIDYDIKKKPGHLPKRKSTVEINDE